MFSPLLWVDEIVYFYKKLGHLSSDELARVHGGITIKLFNWVIYDSDLGWFPKSQYDLNH